MLDTPSPLRVAPRAAWGTSAPVAWFHEQRTAFLIALAGLLLTIVALAVRGATDAEFFAGAAAILFFTSMGALTWATWGGWGFLLILGVVAAAFVAQRIVS